MRLFRESQATLLRLFVFWGENTSALPGGLVWKSKEKRVARWWGRPRGVSSASRSEWHALCSSSSQPISMTCLLPVSFGAPLTMSLIFRGPSGTPASYSFLTALRALSFETLLLPKVERIWGQSGCNIHYPTDHSVVVADLAGEIRAPFFPHHSVSIPPKAARFIKEEDCSQAEGKQVAVLLQ